MISHNVTVDYYWPDPLFVRHRSLAVLGIRQLRNLGADNFCAEGKDSVPTAQLKQTKRR